MRYFWRERLGKISLTSPWRWSLCPLGVGGEKTKKIFLMFYIEGQIKWKFTFCPTRIWARSSAKVKNVVQFFCVSTSKDWNFGVFGVGIDLKMGQTRFSRLCRDFQEKENTFLYIFVSSICVIYSCLTSFVEVSLFKASRKTLGGWRICLFMTTTLFYGREINDEWWCSVSANSADPPRGKKTFLASVDR